MQLISISINTYKRKILAYFALNNGESKQVLYAGNDYERFKGLDGDEVSAIISEENK